MKILLNSTPAGRVGYTVDELEKIVNPLRYIVVINDPKSVSQLIISVFYSCLNRPTLNLTLRHLHNPYVGYDLGSGVHRRHFIAECQFSEGEIKKAKINGGWNPTEKHCQVPSTPCALQLQIVWRCEKLII